MYNEQTIKELDKKASRFEQRVVAAGFNVNDIVRYGRDVTLALLIMMKEDNIDVDDAILKLSIMDI